MIELHDVSFTYDGQTEPSLCGVSLHVEAGECVLVSGPSGCGKSTLLRLANGLIPHFFQGTLQGSVRVGGIVPGEVALYEQASLTGSVFQNPRTQFYTTDTESELAFALENRSVTPRHIVERVEQVVDEMGIAPLMGRSLFALSGGEKQKIACASVQVADAPIILLDEPTANLDYDASLMLADIIAAWKRAGKTVLIAEHRIAWARELIDRLVIMRDGRIVEDLDGAAARNLDGDSCAVHGLRAPMVASPDAAGVPRFDPGANACPAITLENLHFAYEKGVPVLDFDQLAFAQGKITAVVGRNGRGKTTFLRCLTGLEKKDASIVRFGADGEAWDRKKRLGKVFLVAQDVNCQLFTQSVREEVEISLPDGSDTGVVDEVLAALDLADLADRDPFTLSGGQKQRVAVACAIASGRPIVAFDEPTSGLGLAHMLRFATLLEQLASQGRTVVVVTHDTELIEATADYLLEL